MTPEERFTKIENALQALTETQARHDTQIGGLITQVEKQNAGIEKQNAGIRDLIVVSRTLMDTISKLGETVAELSEAQKHTDEKLNALIDTVDRIVRKGNGRDG
jgi:chromosome segregation ATPase